ncbi:MAG: DUF4118 domain-containing protein [Oscillibacter sp.]|nr:DUF4118 domain-containing protein [Oscillibacter sp.]
MRFTLIALSLLTAATAIGLLLWQWRFPAASIIPVYILSVLLCAYFTEGPAYGIAVSVLSVLVFNFFFTDPRFTFRAYDSSYPLTFFVMLAVAMLTGSLTTKVKTQARANARKAYRTEVLLTASQNLQTAENDGDIISETGRQLHKLLGRPILVASVTDGAPDKPLLVTDAPDDSPSPRAVEGLRCVLTGEAGAPAAVRGEDGLYFPIRGHGRVRVVVGVLLNPGENIDEFDRSLLLALLGECGAALEKHRLWQAKQSLAVAAEQEKLRANLLRSISHDLRTPLTTISGNADMLMNGSVVLSDAQRQSLYENIYDDSTWLISLVENLLSITRMDDAALKLNLRPELVGDVLDEAVSHVIRRSGGRTVRVEAGSELLFARMDAPLINQVLVNLLNNAIKYTPEGSVITASAREEGDLVWISVADNGLGVPREAQAHVFEMFYTGEKLRGDDRRGLGLGLALCRAIVEAHGGQITVGDAKPHGAVFSFSLKREEADFNDKAPGADR